jgi:hypothetical protein
VATQKVSQDERQQNGSNAHTASQHTEVSQLGLPCTSRQPPANSEPQLVHKSKESWTQMASHTLSQQYGSFSQTTSQQNSFSQPSVPFGAKQFPAEGLPHCVHRSIASPTHRSSHEVLQQNGSTSHTKSQQDKLSHPLPMCAS